ncbi:MAG: hypothetical protein AAF497_06315, partial [Planctomycetota bacterium]
QNSYSLRKLLVVTAVAAICCLPLYLIGPWGFTVSAWFVILCLLLARRQFAVAFFLALVSLPWLWFVFSLVWL